MPGQKSQLTPLETRKQLLLLESELNRAQLLNEWRDFAGGIRHWQRQAGGVGSLLPLAAVFSVVGRVLARRGEGGNTSWIFTLLNCAKAATPLWRLLRSRRRKDAD